MGQIANYFVQTVEFIFAIALLILIKVSIVPLGRYVRSLFVRIKKTDSDDEVAQHKRTYLHYYIGIATITYVCY